MTATTVAPPSAGAVGPAPVARRGRAWRVATRLATREVRRRWGRTLLVMILVAVPVFGMTAVTVLVRTAQLTPAREFANNFGSADLVAIGNAPAPSGGWPEGTRFLRGREVGEIGLVAADGTARLARVTDVDLGDPVVRGAVLLRAGRFPTRAGEALISPKLARAFDLHVGDQLKLTQPAWTERVVGIGAPASNWNRGLLAVRGNELADGRLQLTVDTIYRITLVQLPGHPSDTELTAYPSEYMSAASATQQNETERAVNWTLVAGVIALGIVGVVISGAFAVGARRQLVTLGQLSANGANERQLRRMLSLQGAWAGALGTAFGLAGAVVTLTLMHGRFSSWMHRDIGRFAWSPRDLMAIAATGVVAATIAAFIPARTAARVPVLSALAGRRPLGALPRSMVPIGAALFGFGVLVLSLVAGASQNGGGDSLALSAVLGGLLVLSGACCVSPVVVASLTRLGGHLRRAGRVAVRSLVRSRASSAAVVMALAAINAGAIAISTAFASETVQSAPAAAFMPDDSLIVMRRATPVLDGAASGFLPIPHQVEEALRTVLPDATWSTRRAVVGSTIDGGSEIGRLGDGQRVIAIFDTSAMFVADPVVLQLVGLHSADEAALQRAGVLVLKGSDSGGESPSATVRVRVGQGADAATLEAPVAQHPVRASAGTSILITPAKARALGLRIEPAGEIITNPKPLDESQRASINALMPTLMFGTGGQNPFGTGGTKADPQPATEIMWSGVRSSEISPNTVRQIILGIVVLIALIVLAMSLALSAAETRDERDVLVALGAPPRTMSAVAAWKAGMLSFTGAALAVPTGFIPVACAYLAASGPGEHARLTFPWSTVLELVLVAPLIAALIAAIGSAVAQRARPTQMSTFATD